MVREECLLVRTLAWAISRGRRLSPTLIKTATLIWPLPVSQRRLPSFWEMVMAGLLRHNFSRLATARELLLLETSTWTPIWTLQLLMTTPAMSRYWSVMAKARLHHQL